MNEFKTDHGHIVSLSIADVCNVFGAHGLKIAPDGEIELLLLGPDDGGWVPLEDAPMVRTGAVQVKPARRS